MKRRFAQTEDESGGGRGARGIASGPASALDTLELKPLGAGNEVGRSCHILRFKGKTIMLDCGILPSFTGIAALPLLDEINPADIDIVIITHFHLDHCAALPHFTERKTGFRGRIFATHPTIAVMKMLWLDYVRISEMEGPAAALYSAEDVAACLARTQSLDFNQRVEVDGVRITFHNAGHVLGAAMALIEIDSVRVLYTGDYFFESDRHLAAAEVPAGLHPDVLVCESTHACLRLPPREEREAKFTAAVERIVKRGGKCLIPVFATGATQELLLILEEFWASRPDLQRIPVLFASKLAAMSLDVYKTFVSHMNPRMQDAMRGRNPWDFRFIRRVREADDAVVRSARAYADARATGHPHEGVQDAPGPVVVLAAPGMLQSGFSRRLFDKWCESAVNGVVLAGYSTEGTLARRLESNPVEVESLSNRRLARHITIDRVQFSAHADQEQSINFLDAVKPARIILVHGERTEMLRFHKDLTRKYDKTGVQVFMPPNGSSVSLRFKQQRILQALGSLAEKRLRAGMAVSGVLVKRNFRYMLMAPEDLPKHTDISCHTFLQKQHVPYRSSFAMLKGFITAMFGDVLEKQGVGSQQPNILIVDHLVRVTHNPPDRIILQWRASPAADLVADTVVALASQADISHAAVAASVRSHPHGHAGHHEHDDAAGHDEEAAAAAAASSASAEPHRFTTDVRLAHTEAAAVVWSRNESWAQRLFMSDSSVFSTREVAQELMAVAGAAAATEAAFYTSTTGVPHERLFLLAPPALRRRDLLLRILLDAFGDDNVSYAGPHAEQLQERHPFMPTFESMLPAQPAPDPAALDTFAFAVRCAGTPVVGVLSHAAPAALILALHPRADLPGVNLPLPDSDDALLAASSTIAAAVSAAADEDGDAAAAVFAEYREPAAGDERDDTAEVRAAVAEATVAARGAAAAAHESSRTPARVHAFAQALVRVCVCVSMSLAPVDDATPYAAAQQQMRATLQQPDDQDGPDLADDAIAVDDAAPAVPIAV